MTKKWIAINLALLATTGLLGWQLYRSARQFNVDSDLARLQPARGPMQKINLEGGLAPIQPPRKYNAGEFGVIAAKNVFSETRGKVEPEAVAQTLVAPGLAVKPVLVAITIAGNQRLASIIDPQAGGTPGARKTQIRRLGDVYQGYTIVDIAENQIVLENAGRKEIVPLFDNTKQKTPGGKTAILASRVVNFGGGGPGAATSAVASRDSVAASVQGPRPGQPAANTAQAQANQPTRAALQPQQQQPRPTPPGNAQQSQQQQGATWNERVDEQGRRIIRTPFGDIIRDKPPND